MIGGLVGTVGFFALHWPVNYAGLGAFALSICGMIVGSLVQGSLPPIKNKEVTLRG